MKNEEVYTRLSPQIAVGYITIGSVRYFLL